ncbi:MAG TPA: acylphosphatase [Stellaceae bacterium]|nr:acylphosphatase [Stellaceae bacterium]
MPAERILVSGVVQGVGFRWWAVRTARRLGITGWVRNRFDGTVEIHAVAERDTLDAFALACAEGPRGARIEQVDRRPDVDEGREGFEQLATA